MLYIDKMHIVYKSYVRDYQYRKTPSRALHCRKLIGIVRWILQNKSPNELVSPSAARWRDQHALPPLCLSVTVEHVLVFSIRCN